MIMFWSMNWLYSKLSQQFQSKSHSLFIWKFSYVITDCINRVWIQITTTITNHLSICWHCQQIWPSSYSSTEQSNYRGVRWTFSTIFSLCRPNYFQPRFFQLWPIRLDWTPWQSGQKILDLSRDKIIVLLLPPPSSPSGSDKKIIVEEGEAQGQHHTHSSVCCVTILSI